MSIYICPKLFRMILNKEFKKIDMKRNLLLIAAFITGGYAFAQVTDTVSMGAGYGNENYYTLNNGNEVAVVRNDWDLAFASDGVGFGSSSIRINGPMGVELYKYSSSIGDWSTVDTTGFAWGANQLVDSEESWTVGAFENTTPVSAFDLGWGTYSTVTHIVTGDRIFILKLSNGDYKKMIVNSLISGVYSFQYADLNGSNLVNTTITKSNYSGKNFGYYSIQNTASLDREPVSSSWDLLFTKYITDLGIYYGVTGVVANVGVEVAQVYPVNDVNTESHLGQSYTTNITTIGYDWKQYTGTYVIEDSLVYFVEVPNADIYRIIFTGFGGSSTGDFIFTKELVGTVGIEEDVEESEILSVYPNPVSDIVNVTFIGSNNTQISIYDVTGKQVFEKNSSNTGLTQEKIDVSNLKKGIYFLMLTTAKNKSTQKIIVQ